MESDILNCTQKKSCTLSCRTYISLDQTSLVMDLVSSVLTINMNTTKSSDITYIIHLNSICTLKMFKYTGFGLIRAYNKFKYRPWNLGLVRTTRGYKNRHRLLDILTQHWPGAFCSMGLKMAIFDKYLKLRCN